MDDGIKSSNILLDGSSILIRFDKDGVRKVITMSQEELGIMFKLHRSNLSLVDLRTMLSNFEGGVREVRKELGIRV